ncbi:unnamed protein product [Blepharisma stoltei]|uniref:Peptidase C1A papain C-terminal domain-containing protein n=1 Tax=Blepharisma stoltei TaxID=1481888 RepID=A0AAU9IL02_9CILI|nr:unnamed protein product [Blepharisma stoltei]
MKYLSFFAPFVLSLSGLVIQPKDSDLVSPQDMIDEINSTQGSWVASADWVGHMATTEAKRKVSSKPISPKFPEYDWGVVLNYLSIPSSFDSRTQWPDCIHPIQNIGICEGDWAYSAAGALSDRFCIASNKNINVVLSPGYVIVCDIEYDNRCSGGTAGGAWNFLKQYGTPLASCVPMHSWSVDDGCPNKCNSGESLQFYKAASVNSYSGPSSIQAAILTNGPVETTMHLYQDFSSYKGGIYKHTTGSLLGSVSVKLIGWGNQNGTNYWIGANCWGTSWGMKGYFWIAFGECGIDTHAVAGSPYI